jgi:hypothetical protein
VRTEDATIYLCGPINGRVDADCKSWRENVKSRWPGVSLDPLRRDYRGREMQDVKKLVHDDLADIDASHGVLVWFDKPSVGTSMEIFYAKHVKRLPVVTVDVLGEGRHNPWLVCHSDYMVDTITDALALLLHKITTVNGH